MSVVLSPARGSRTAGRPAPMRAARRHPLDVAAEIALGAEVARMRARGLSWGAIALQTGRSEITLRETYGGLPRMFPAPALAETPEPRGSRRAASHNFVARPPEQPIVAPGTLMVIALDTISRGPITAARIGEAHGWSRSTGAALANPLFKRGCIAPVDPAVRPRVWVITDLGRRALADLGR